MANKEANYRMVDFDTWKRADLFRYFLNVEKCIITVTANVDVTDFVARCKEHGLNFYSTFICLMAYVLNQKEYFRFGYDQKGNVIVYDSINPFYTDSVGKGESFNCIVSDYCPDMNKLYATIVDDRKKYRDVEILEPVNMADNIFSITVLPSVHYTQLELNDASRLDSLAPAIAIGKYEMHEGKLMLPLTLWIHHAVCDGFHVGKFYEAVENSMAKIVDEIIKGKGDIENGNDKRTDGCVQGNG